MQNRVFQAKIHKLSSMGIWHTYGVPYLCHKNDISAMKLVVYHNQIPLELNS